MIKVYFDTNMLEDYSGNNVVISNKILSEKFYNFIKLVSENATLHSVMTIVIPQVVIDEISQHIKESVQYIEEEFNKISGVYKIFKAEDHFNFSKLYKDLTDIFENEIIALSNKFHFISVEKQNDDLKYIYDRAINKQAPFYAKNKKLDSGFKDMLLIKTALEHQNSANLIICSGDPDFCGTGTEIEIIKSFENLIEKVNNEYISKEEKIKSIISQEYIKDRILDELNIQEKDKKISQINLISYFEVDDPEFINTQIVKLEIRVRRKRLLAEFYLDLPTSEIVLFQIIK